MSLKLLTLQDFVDNFPFPEIRSQQLEVLQEICDAFNSGYKCIVLEAPTGFGKSAVAVCVARTLGKSYICCGTKDLQTQYARDFRFLKTVKGMGEFKCLAKEDRIADGSYLCNQCNEYDSISSGTNAKECGHRSVKYGYCRGESPTYHDNKTGCSRCGTKALYKGDVHSGCPLKIHADDLIIINRNTPNEEIVIDPERLKILKNFSAYDGLEHSWGLHNLNLSNKKRSSENFEPCGYFLQKAIGELASHTIYNYANFQIYLRRKNHEEILPTRDLLILDEGHNLEDEMVNQISQPISSRKLQKFMDISYLDSLDLTFEDDISKWSEFLNDLYDRLEKSIPKIKSHEARVDAEEYLMKLAFMNIDVEADPMNWIVSNIEVNLGGHNRKDISVKTTNDLKRLLEQRAKITNIGFKPLDVSRYCRRMFEKGERTIIMSATILDVDTFCGQVGLDKSSIKYISAKSDFPVENRKIHLLNIVQMNKDTLKEEVVQKGIAQAIDILMDAHHDQKGIIHCTSYPQTQFIERYLSIKNKHRLIFTDPNIPRDDILKQHFDSKDPTVLISPSLHTGLDLKDDFSRFQIIVKTPYPDLGDRWVSAKKNKNHNWYSWRACLRLVQAYGRSVRSKTDYADTYILDKAINDFLSKNRSRLPDWFMEAID